MTLLEVLLAGALFFGSSAVSLLLWSRTVATLEADAHRGALLEGLEAELQAAESRLRDPALSGSPEQPCDQRLLQLVAALQREPAAAGVLRQVLVVSPTEPLQLQLIASGLERRRSYDPAAFGGCVGAATAMPGPAAAAASDSEVDGQPQMPRPDSASLSPAKHDAAS